MPKISPRRIFDGLLWLAVLFMLIQKVPLWISNMKSEGAKVVPFSVSDEQGERRELPALGQKQVLIFWATWCGPCTLELKRFNSAVKDGELRADQIIAISIGEDPAVVYKEARERDYRFTVLVDPENVSTRSLAVDGTPTTYHLDAEGKIAHASTGASMFPVWRAKSFLQ